MKRTPKAEQRRRDLCDAAIAVLAADGARGLTHRRVDRHAGFPEGTTSFYYQTRAALLPGRIPLSAGLRTDRRHQCREPRTISAFGDRRGGRGPRGTETVGRSLAATIMASPRLCLAPGLRERQQRLRRPGQVRMSARLS